MKQLLALCAVVVLCATAAQAATPQPVYASQAAVMKPVMAWVRAFDSHQATFPSDAFTDDCIMIDEFAPFAWSPGKGDVRAWYASVEGLDSHADRAQTVASKETVVVGTPENLRFDGRLAYMTFHATWSGVGQKHRRFVQHGLFTVVERYTTAGWRMSANAWGILP